MQLILLRNRQKDQQKLIKAGAKLNNNARNFAHATYTYIFIMSQIFNVALTVVPALAMGFRQKQARGREPRNIALTAPKFLFFYS